MEHLEPFPSFLYCTILDLFAIFPVFFFFFAKLPNKGQLKTGMCFLPCFVSPSDFPGTGL